MTETTRAAIVAAPGADFELTEVEVGPPRANEILVRMQAVGVCHTDLLAREGNLPIRPPAVFGHEGTGTVESIGDSVRDLEPGDRVALSFDFCGSCRNCLAGRPAYCHRFRPLNFSGSRADGTTALSRYGVPVHSHFFGQSAFAEIAIVSRNSATKIESAIPAEILAPFGCGFQTGAGAVLNSLRPRPGDSVAIFGLGGVGMVAVMAARLSGCQAIIAVDPDPARLRIAAELGATEALDPTAVETAGAIQEMTGGGTDFSLEMSGTVEALEQAVLCLAPGGVCGLVGAAGAGARIPLEIRSIVAPGRTLRGIVEGDSVPARFIPELVSLWEAGALPLERLIGTSPFEDINEVVSQPPADGVVKSVLKFEASGPPT